MDTLQATGVAMLFSAGTFLYVSTVHVLPEVTSVGHGNGFSKCELIMLVIGTLVPLLLTFGHHHWYCDITLLFIAIWNKITCA